MNAMVDPLSDLDKLLCFSGSKHVQEGADTNPRRMKKMLFVSGRANTRLARAQISFLIRRSAVRSPICGGCPDFQLEPVIFTTAPVSNALPVPPPRRMKMHPTFTVFAGPFGFGVVLFRVQVNEGLRVPLNNSAAVPSTTCIV